MDDKDEIHDRHINTKSGIRGRGLQRRGLSFQGMVAKYSLWVFHLVFEEGVIIFGCHLMHRKLSEVKLRPRPKSQSKSVGKNGKNLSVNRDLVKVFIGRVHNSYRRVIRGQLWAPFPQEILGFFLIFTIESIANRLFASL